MKKRFFAAASLAGLLASAGSLPAQDNQNTTARPPTLEDRIDQLEQAEQDLKGRMDQLRDVVADLQDRVKRLEGGQQPSQAPLPAAQSSESGRRTGSAS